MAIDITHVASIAHKYHNKMLLFYVEFTDMAGKQEFEVHMPSGVLIAETGTIYIPIDIDAGDHIVTLTSVKHVTKDADIIRTMSEYGHVRSVYHGFHSVGALAIDNGRRYIVYGGCSTKQIPSVVQVNSDRVKVKYIANGIQAPYTCGSPPVDTQLKIPFEEISPPRSHSPMLSEPLEVLTFASNLPVSPVVTTCLKAVQTEQITTQNQQVEAKVKCRNMASMTDGADVQDNETNTEQIVLVDMGVQRNNHVKRKMTQTDPVDSKDEKIQCCMVPTLHAYTQTLTLYDEVKECRQFTKMKRVVPRKRKRAQSGKVLPCNVPKDLKSHNTSAQSIHQYLQTKKPKLAKGVTQTQSQCSVCPNDFNFDFQPKMSMDTIGALICWKCDKVARIAERVAGIVKTGEG
jgi:hypothetical protein